MNNRVQEFAHRHNGKDNAVSERCSPGPEIQSALQAQAAKTIEWIRQNPAAATGAALLLGVVLGWIIKRR